MYQRYLHTERYVIDLEQVEYVDLHDYSSVVRPRETAPQLCLHLSSGARLSLSGEEARVVRNYLVARAAGPMPLAATKAEMIPFPPPAGVRSATGFPSLAPTPANHGEKTDG